MKPFILPKNSPQGLQALLSGGLWNQWVRQGLVFDVPDIREAISYIRNKPESCRLFVKGPVEGTADTAPQGMNIRLFSDLHLATSFYEKLISKNLNSPLSGFAPFIDKENFAVGLPFPGDAEIPQLRRIFEPNRFRRLVEPMLGTIDYDQWRLQKSLTRHKLVAYKPGRRAVLKTKLKLRNLKEDIKVRKLFHLKVENRISIEKSKNLALAISHATENCAHFSTPSFVGTSPAMNIFGHEWVEGLHPDLKSSNIEETIQKIALALNEFHQIPLEISSHPPPQILMNEVEKIVEDLSELVPDLRFELLNLANQFIKMIPRLNLLPSVLSHGDLHRNQILLNQEKLYLLDFDRAGRGYACIDLGALMEDFSELGASEDLANQLATNYQKITKTKMTIEELQIGRVIACLRRSFQPFRSLSPNWPSETADYVDHCINLMKGFSNE